MCGGADCLKRTAGGCAHKQAALGPAHRTQEAQTRIRCACRDAVRETSPLGGREPSTLSCSTNRAHRMPPLFPCEALQGSPDGQ